MSIVELSGELKTFVDESRARLESILGEPVRNYIEANVADPEWFGAVMHNAGSEPDEAIRLFGVVNEVDRELFAKAVVRRLAGGIVSTAFMPALLPSALLSGTNQAVLGSLRERVSGELDEG